VPTMRHNRGPIQTIPAGHQVARRVYVFRSAHFDVCYLRLYLDHLWVWLPTGVLHIHISVELACFYWGLLIMGAEQVQLLYIPQESMASSSHAFHDRV